MGLRAAQGNGRAGERKLRQPCRSPQIKFDPEFNDLGFLKKQAAMDERAFEAKPAAPCKRQLSCFEFGLHAMMQRTALLSHLVKNNALQG
jgi:hypothetical protein